MATRDNTIWVDDVISKQNSWNLNKEEKELVRLAKESPKKRSRICLHQSPNSSSQFMLIQALEQSFIPIHKHKNSFEAYIPIFGDAYLLLFNDQLVLTQKIFLSNSNEVGLANCHGVPPNCWHTFIVSSDSFKYFEFKESMHYENDIVYNIGATDSDAIKLLKDLKIGEKI